VICTNKKPKSSKGSFECLSRGSLYEWFTPKGKLKKKYYPYVQHESQFIPSTPHDDALSSRPDLVKIICDMLFAIRDSS